MNVKIEQSWHDALRNEFDKDYFIKLTDFVRGEYLSGKRYTQMRKIFLTHLIYVHLILSKL